MHVDVVMLPHDLKSGQLAGSSVVVFDVLRATTSMTMALFSGAAEIRIFGSIQAALEARRAFTGDAVLCGEVDALPPPGFDLGNSPAAFTPQVVAGRTIFMSTTNGTRAILASLGAELILTGALVNAAAVARALAAAQRDVILLCAGTQGAASMEDMIGCGAVIESLARLTPIVERSDLCRIAARLFAATKNDLPSVLRETTGGRNVQRVRLTSDIDFAAQLNRFDLVGRVMAGNPPVVRALQTAIA